MGDASMLAVREQDVASCELYGPGGHLSLVRRRGDRTTVVTLVADAQPEAPIEVTLDEAQTRFLKEFLLWIGGGGREGDDYGPPGQWSQPAACPGATQRGPASHLARTGAAAALALCHGRVGGRALAGATRRAAVAGGSPPGAVPGSDGWA
jgi:hypothetical protein